MEARVEPKVAYGGDDAARRGPVRRRSRIIYFSLAGLAVVVLVAGITIWRHGTSTHVASPPRVPVTATDAKQPRRADLL